MKFKMILKLFRVGQYKKVFLFHLFLRLKCQILPNRLTAIHEAVAKIYLMHF